MFKPTISYKNTSIIIFFLTLSAIFALATVSAADDQDFIPPFPNPAAKYCQDLGYQWGKEMTEAGEVGVCVMPDGSRVDEWGFATGKVATKWNYCSQKGYKMKTVNDSAKCQTVFSKDCVVCVLDNGNEIESTELAKIESQPEKCGDKFCSKSENAQNCPQDCRAFSALKDINVKQESVSNKNLLIIAAGASLFFIFLIIATIYYIKKRKDENNNNDVNDIKYTQPK